MAGKGNEPPVIIIKRVKKGNHDAPHGGAWKVAYADFVTSMMAFFLLLWLLNVTTNLQKDGIADYFAPASLSQSSSGAGGMFGGKTMIEHGSRIATGGTVAETRASDINPPHTASAKRPAKIDAKTLARKLAEQEQKTFEKAKRALYGALAANPGLAGLKKHLLVDMTPRGLRIQIIDSKNQSMFPSGSAKMYPRTRKLLLMIAPVIAKLPNKLMISGHTDSTPYPAGATYNNWDLSSARANATRRVLVAANVPSARVEEVVGRADRDPLLPNDPTNARNRRITITLLRQHPLTAPTPAGTQAAAATPPPEPAVPVLPGHLLNPL